MNHFRRLILTITAVISAFALTVSLTAFTLLTALNGRTIWTDAALRSTEERMQSFETGVRAIAAGVGFAPETALIFYPSERITRVTGERVDWIFSLLHGDTPVMPDLSADGLTESIVADPSFPGGTRIAREDGTYEIERLAERTFLPLRASLMRMAAEKAAPHTALIRRANRLLRMLPWIGLTLSLIGMALTVMLLGFSAAKACTAIGAVAAAGGIGAAVLVLPWVSMRIPAAIAEVSPLFAEEIAGIEAVFLTRHLLSAVCVMAVGWLLFALSRRKWGEST